MSLEKPSTTLPIVGSDKPCILDEDDKKWFENRTLHLSKDGYVVFYEPFRGKVKEYYMNMCVLCMGMSTGENEMHPNGVAALKRWIKAKTPVDIQKYCLDSLKQRHIG